MSNVLQPLDQAVFDIERATGTANLLQCAWILPGAVNRRGLEHFHQRLRRDVLASRRIERSPLPFGRHRWVASSRMSDIEFVTTARPRSDFSDWLNEQPGIMLDPEHGPGWHLAALPFTDGGSGVSLVISHCLTDGIGLCDALVNAAGDGDADANWPDAASRRRSRALREDLRQTVRDTPAVGRAGAAVLRMGRQERESAEPTLPEHTGGDEMVVIPRATIFVDAGDWDSRAETLGGTSNTLLAAFAARLATGLRRVTADGLVTLDMPVNERTPGDTRAGAVRDAHVTVDPTSATTDLSGMRTAIKHALMQHRETADDEMALMPLVPLLPRRVLRRMVNVVHGSATRVVSSNLGAIDEAANRPDGTEAAYFAMMWKYPHVTRELLHQGGGILALLSGRLHGRVFVSVFAYQPGHSNDQLPQRLVDTLREFSLTGTVL
ncbi:hypothetical protein O6P37_14670 [Mycobacterium sp. CPCC 205372]|uniref:Fatty acyl-AMP ligase FadD28 and polyketide synthase n=1 Tax=Mycobacterium hippophais TaxID=3016340 RepID=A0ABT4PUA9_9MYCO|nr:hypothetical protein [Mycobacterium hippophais]MCZ8380113.1 hypothetical protein [Mycobacterium hippophais]